MARVGIVAWSPMDGGRREVGRGPARRRPQGRASGRWEVLAPEDVQWVEGVRVGLGSGSNDSRARVFEQILGLGGG